MLQIGAVLRWDSAVFMMNGAIRLGFSAVNGMLCAIFDGNSAVAILDFIAEQHSVDGRIALPL